jgi:LPXTG-motif cell wall-anchored protein
LIFQWICNGVKFACNLLIREKGLYPNLLIWEGDRMMLLLFSIAGVIVGVIAAGTSPSVISNSEALMLIGISIVGGAIFFRNKKRKHSSLR